MVVLHQADRSVRPCSIPHHVDLLKTSPDNTLDKTSAQKAGLSNWQVITSIFE